MPLETSSLTLDEDSIPRTDLSEPILNVVGLCYSFLSMKTRFSSLRLAGRIFANPESARKFNAK